MPRFAANLTMMYGEYAFPDRFAAAAKDGFTAVEYLFPYEYPPNDLATWLREHGLIQVLLNAPPGNFAVGERGLASLPGREAEFRAGIRTALEYAQTLACPRVHVMAGVEATGVERAAMRGGREKDRAARLPQPRLLHRRDARLERGGARIMRNRKSYSGAQHDYFSLAKISSSFTMRWIACPIGLISICSSMPCTPEGLLGLNSIPVKL